MKKEELLDLPRPVSRHPKMSASSRAAQFAPFAALTGYSAVLSEIDREKVKRMELDEDERAALDAAFVQLEKGKLVHVRWFDTDVIKECTDHLKRWSEAERWILLQNGTRIEFENLMLLELICAQEEE